ncbi:hypothetical protein FRC08_004132, partial [Ceratobasidium sp. 394]
MSFRTHYKSVFATPELIALICVHLDPNDSICLARSSNRLFQTVMPLVWRYVNGVSQLLALLPAPAGVDETKNEGQIAERTFTENDFSRFNIYAPWIKHIEICRTLRCQPTRPELDALCRYSTTHVLLPHLRSITSTNIAGIADATWVLPFLCSSLISLEFVIASFARLPKLPPSESLVLLHVIATKCPKLLTLSMAGHPDANDSPDPYSIQYLPYDEKTNLEEQLPLGLGRFVASIRPLVNLTFSAEILDPACFRTIGTWPSLKSLVITMDPNKRDYFLPELDDDSFPALKHLGLYWISDMDTFQRILSAPALTKKLTSVKLLPSRDICCHFNGFSAALSRLLSIVAEQSPSLQSLWLRMAHPAANHPVYDTSLTVL